MKNIHIEKLHYVEILKISIISLVIFLHVCEIFSYPAITYIKDNSINCEELTIIVRFFNQWIMSAMFFFAGIGSYYSLKSKTWKKYVVERIKRLYIPMIFGTLFLVSIQTYILAKTQYGFNGSLFDFIPVFIGKTGISPDGYLNWGHLWFISYLFHFSLLALPFFVYSLKESKPNFIQKILYIIEKGSVYLPLVLLILIECVFRPHWPGSLDLINDWANFLTYFLVFVYGFLFVGGFLKLQYKKLNRTILLIVYLISSIAMFIYWHFPYPKEAYNFEYLSLRIASVFYTWLSIIFWIDLGRNKFNVSNRFIQYASSLTMPFYVLHYVVLTVIGYYVVQLKLEMISKIALVFIPSFIVTVLACEIVKRFVVLRFLLGLK